MIISKQAIIAATLTLTLTEVFMLVHIEVLFKARDVKETLYDFRGLVLLSFATDLLKNFGEVLIGWVPHRSLDFSVFCDVDCTVAHQLFLQLSRCCFIQQIAFSRPKHSFRPDHFSPFLSFFTCILNIYNALLIKPTGFLQIPGHCFIRTWCNQWSSTPRARVIIEDDLSGAQTLVQSPVFARWIKPSFYDNATHCMQSIMTAKRKTCYVLQ